MVDKAKLLSHHSKENKPDTKTQVSSSFWHIMRIFSLPRFFDFKFRVLINVAKRPTDHYAPILRGVHINAEGEYEWNNN